MAVAPAAQVTPDPPAPDSEKPQPTSADALRRVTAAWKSYWRAGERQFGYSQTTPSPSASRMYRYAGCEPGTGAIPWPRLRRDVSAL